MVQDRTLCDPLVHASGSPREGVLTYVKDAHTEDGRKGAVGDRAVALLGPETVRDDRRGAVWKLTSELGCLHAIEPMGWPKFDFHTGANKHATYDW